ncbi:MAG: phenylalanine--tRNA ligase beta subunit [Leptospiraceae bacterium]|nr:MAG: phenylalanine--tRNA ligase beta subunit [Leptospiraceae bacterium]
MKLSYNWLNQYINLKDIDIHELANRITMSTCEIEEIYTIFDFDENIVIAKVLECSKHPNSDKLTICKVDDGKNILQVLCGASNVKEGIFVVLAKIGAKLIIEEKPLTIDKRSIRGVDSYGMICSAKELGIDSIIGDNNGIIILDELSDEIFLYAYQFHHPQKINEIKDISKIKKQFLKPGTPIKKLFPYIDIILDIDNKSITHRPDLWGHFGFARELSAILKRNIHYDPLETKIKIKQDPSLPVKKIEIKNHSALAYNGVVCTNIQIKDSPLWMKILLTAIGQKVINNVVDVSNYIMYELGQPNHAFDLKELKSDIILCDLTKKEIEFTALDEETYKIPKGSIIIYDGKKPVALGGIIGGLNSAIKSDTTEIFIESATFPREYIRKTISATGIRTESARRFEKGQDPYKSKIAIYRFIELLKETCPDIKIGKIESSFQVPEKKENHIKTTVDFIQMKLGFSISPKEIQSILERLYFKVKIKNNTIEVIVPSFRSYYDITIPEDLVEEIGRIYGYDNIQPVAPVVEIQKPDLPYNRYFERRIKQFISSYGLFFETMNYSFAKKEDNELFGYSGIQLKNPAQKQKDRMRVSLIPGLLEQIQFNIHRYEEAGLYELGKIFIPKKKQSKDIKKKLPEELNRLTIVYFTEELKNYKNYIMMGDDERIGVVLYLRNLLENLFNYFHIEYNLTIPDNPYFFLHPKCQLEIYHQNDKLGVFGLLHPEWHKKYEYPKTKTVVIADLDYDTIFTIWNRKREKKETYYRPPSQFPKSTFEFTILLDKNESTYKPVEYIKNLFPEFREIELVDIYIGPPIPEEKKSISYRVHCIDYKPITNERLQEMLDTVVKLLNEKGYPLRS